MILKLNKSSKTVDVFYGETGWYPHVRLTTAVVSGKLHITAPPRTPDWVLRGARRIMGIITKREVISN